MEAYLGSLLLRYCKSNFLFVNSFGFMNLYYFLTSDLPHTRPFTNLKLLSGIDQVTASDFCPNPSLSENRPEVYPLLLTKTRICATMEE